MQWLLNAQVLAADGQRFTITNGATTTRTFEFDNGTGTPLATGIIGIPFTSGIGDLYKYAFINKRFDHLFQLVADSKRERVLPSIYEFCARFYSNFGHNMWAKPSFVVLICENFLKFIKEVC